MSDYQSINEKFNHPQPTFDSILSKTFSLYQGVIGFAIGAGLLYVLLQLILEVAFGIDDSQYENIRNASDILKIEGLGIYSSMSTVINLLLSPLYVGFIYVMNKFHNHQIIEFSDLFIGYRQNLLQIILYSFLIYIILGIAFTLCFLPGLFVFPLLFLGYPILLFENATAIDAIKKSYNIAINNYGTFFAVSIISCLLSFLGFFACCIGIIITMFFMCGTSYTTYVAFLGKPTSK